MMETGTVTHEVSDGAPVTGWRAWLVTETQDGLRLGSVIHDELWIPGTTALAACRRHEDVFADPLPAHTTPSVECECGFHAAYDPADVFAYLRGREERTTV